MSRKYADFADKIDIEALEIAIGFEPMETRGENDIGKCLFSYNHTHGDTTGKFAIHRGKRVYNCFVCGGGSLLALVKRLYHFDTETATDYLYNFTKSDVLDQSAFVEGYLKDIRTPAPENRKGLPVFRDAVLDQYDGPTDWFHTRGISDEVIQSYSLCFATKARRTNKQGEKLENYVGEAAVFPHFFDEKLVGMQFRWMGDQDRPKWIPKYTNTKDFPKTETLFNYDNAKKVADRSIFVVESVPTALFLISHGFPAVATFGSSVSEHQLKLLRKLHGIVLAPDKDAAGKKFLYNCAEYLQDYVAVDYVDPEDYGEASDLGDFPKEFGKIESTTALIYVSQMHKPWISKSLQEIIK